MITEKQRDLLLEMITSHGNEEALRGLFIGRGNSEQAEKEGRFCSLKLEKIKTFLDNITVKNDL